MSRTRGEFLRQLRLEMSMNQPVGRLPLFRAANNITGRLFGRTKYLKLGCDRDAFCAPAAGAGLLPTPPTQKQGGRTLASPGRNNSITDVEGLTAGSYTDPGAVCGTTVILAEESAVAGVDVRGSAPGTRETDLLNPINLVDSVHAVVLTGGSVYGLATADGVVRMLSKKGIGFPLDEDGHVAPIVPAAVLYDLGQGPEFVPPIGPDWGVGAARAAGRGALELGCVGAGTGAVAGSIKGGLGSASLVMDCGITVAAVVGANPGGSVVNPATGRPWEVGLELEGEFGEQGKRAVELPPAPGQAPARNTTIALVACDAALTKIQATKVAQMAHDGMGRAIRPAHTMFDGDTIFCLATGMRPLHSPQGFFPMPEPQAVTEIGHAAADCLSRAIIRAVLAAESLPGVPAWRDLPDRN